MSLFSDHMLQHEATRADIVSRCLAAQLGDEPPAPQLDLGDTQLPNGDWVKTWLVHAADAVLLDAHGHIALITRLHNPGRGKLAVPGGLVDALDDRMETSREAALREAMEETGISPLLLAHAQIDQIGHRAFARPFDIRRAWGNVPGTDVRPGELFTVSTLGFRVLLPGNLRDIPLEAGDDAKGVGVFQVSELDDNAFAVPDHPQMIRAALAL
jgi:ADP-ribose pyrophosphatase YjhB (NUDIX family)